jgi:hypothetical protein
MGVPVALIIFNRPSLTRRVFERIREYRPPRLLVIADGPRSSSEVERCDAARAVIDLVDWDCDLHRNYSDVNLGCNDRFSSGLSWVFDQCEKAIILEDDCLPHPSFFRYCEDLLEIYQQDERISTINGSNFLHGWYGRTQTQFSYYFSAYPHSWGWATWQRAWRHYTDSVKFWPSLRTTGWLHDILTDTTAEAYYRDSFDALLRGERSWDFQWTLASWTQRSLAIAPAVNLISNLGCGEGATHAVAATKAANLPFSEVRSPLHHPPGYVARNVEADRTEFKWRGPSVLYIRYSRLRRQLGVVLPDSVRARLFQYLPGSLR